MWYPPPPPFFSLVKIYYRKISKTNKGLQKLFLMQQTPKNTILMSTCLNFSK